MSAITIKCGNCQREFIADTAGTNDKCITCIAVIAAQGSDPLGKVGPDARTVVQQDVAEPVDPIDTLVNI